MEKWYKQWIDYAEKVNEQIQYITEKEQQLHLSVLHQSSENVLDKYVEMNEKVAAIQEKMEMNEEDRLDNYESIGTSYFHLNMFEKAINEFEKEWQNNNVPILKLYLSYSYLYVGKYEKAKEQFLYIIHSKEKKIYRHFAYVGLGCLAAQLAHIDEAIVQFEKALTLTMNRDVLYNLGICHYLQKQPQLAVPYFQKLLTLLPEDGETYFFLGCCYFSMNEKNKAYEAWFSALQVVETKELLLTMAYKFEESGLFITAIHCYDRLKALGYEDLSVYHGLAWNFGLIDERQKSKNLLEQLLQQNPVNPDLWISYFWLLDAWGETEILQKEKKHFSEQLTLSHPLIEKIFSNALS